MILEARLLRGFPDVRIVGVLSLVVAGLANGGCSNRAPLNEAMKQQLAEMKGDVLPVGKFSGTVTIDGQPPEVPPKSALVLILYNAEGRQPGQETILDTICDKQGHFEFTRYSKGDGVPAGSYTVLFAELRPRRGGQFGGPDKLGNLYNDPDKSSFHVDIEPPGKSDWDFNLEVAGKDSLPPGPHAITQVIKR
jgi:hypothetical protein